MELYLFFETLVFAAIIVLVLFILRTLLITISLKEIYRKRYVDLQNQLNVEIQKKQIINQRFTLIDSLSKSLQERIFKIMEELILFQKFIFEKHN